MRILVAPDKFKNSLGARDVGDCIAAGLREVLPNATIEILPLADGGEGTAEAICQARGGEWVNCDAHDALGLGIEARYVRKDATVVMEMSEAAGGWRIAREARDLLRANTYGVGEMLLDASNCGAEEITVGLGGSATNDGGMGMARALGFRFLDETGNELGEGPAQLLRLARIGSPPVLPLHGKIVAAADVQNPLLGERGATRIFGPQKGGTPSELAALEDSLGRLADIAARDLGCEFRDAPGAGAAGGLGFGLMTFCGASLRPGFDLVAEMLDLRAAIERADVVKGSSLLGQEFTDPKYFWGRLSATTPAYKRPY